jgi:hypothetical protein
VIRADLKTVQAQRAAKKAFSGTAFDPFTPPLGAIGSQGNDGRSYVAKSFPIKMLTVDNIKAAKSTGYTVDFIPVTGRGLRDVRPSKDRDAAFNRLLK